ncbi:hypothetical protein OG883_44440 [Streptomyces sp. NBC_01142]|uniref:hypothetical protein n=1 Tax=Streptomyces sp. NBC_01142 TaxID=2975865 RepID=UPI00225BA5AB|nr:hypothetical protein [Streptomyces sp. NBC_01142]MCX4826694.1 hypothetical protein [Streptomyces sp. NBC_01142]
MTGLLEGAVYESLRPCGPDRRPTRLLVTEPGTLETRVVNAYTGRGPRTIPSSRLHERIYLTESRRYVRSGYLRMREPAVHVAAVLRTALTAAKLSADLLSGCNFGADPVRGGTASLRCLKEHRAVQVCTNALGALGYSAELVPAGSPDAALLRVRYGPGGIYCPVRWLTREDWTMHYCGQQLRHGDESHFDPYTGGVWWDGDDDGLSWPGTGGPAPRR